MKLELYYAPTSCALVPYITLSEAGAGFTVQALNLRKNQQYEPGYLQLNPKHKVPVLVIDGEALTENVAIQIWIARTYPAAQLLPREPAREIRAISFMAWCASGIHPMLTPALFPQRFCDTPGSEEGVRRCAHRTLLEHFTVAEQALADRDWLFGDFSAADAYFFWCFRRGLQVGVELGPFLNGQAHFARMRSRPSVQRALAFDEALTAEFARPG